MRAFLLCLLLFSGPAFAQGPWQAKAVVPGGAAPAAWTLLTSAVIAGAANGGTSSAIDTTGASVIIFHLADTGGGVVSDSKGNTWSGCAGSPANIPQSSLFCAFNPIVGSGHTFTVTGTTIFSRAQIAAFSDNSPIFLGGSGNNGALGTGTTLQPGALSPSVNNSLVVSGVASNNTGTVSIDSGFTIVAQGPLAGGVAFGGALAYFFQGTAASINPTWSGLATSSGASILSISP